MFLIIMNKQDSRQLENPEQIEQSRTVLIPYYRWWSYWWPYYYGSGSSTYYSTYRYPRHRHHRHHRHHKHKYSKKSITIIADRTGKTHVASKNSVIPVTVSGKRDNVRLAKMKNNFTNISKSNTKSISVKIPNKSVSNNKILLLAKSKSKK